MVKAQPATMPLFHGIFCVVLLASGLAAARGQSQTGNGASRLPEAPLPSVPPAPQAGGQSTGIISGTILDSSGSVVQSATVTLLRGGRQVAVVQSGSNGQFAFTGLPAGRFTVTAAGKGMGTGRSSRIALPAGGVRYMKPIVLPVLGATTVVRVTGNQQAIAEQDVRIEESQRVLGVLPNFYTAFDWNAPPLNAKQKFQLAWRSFIDPTTFAEAGMIAGGEQFEGLYSGFGTGGAGFGKRYGAALANTFDSRLFGEALFPAIFHQDPRYFYKGTGSAGSRVLYALEESMMTRGRSGRQQFDYSRVLANFAAGGMSNLYYPQANRGVALVFENGAIEIGGAAATNLLREFVLPRLTKHSALGPGAAQP
jgi:hypothetical protein